MTLATAKKECALLGLTLVKRDDEYIVKPSGASNDDSRAYYTNDLDDAVQTARSISQKGA